MPAGDFSRIFCNFQFACCSAFALAMRTLLYVNSESSRKKVMSAIRSTPALSVAGGCAKICMVSLRRSSVLDK